MIDIEDISDIGSLLRILNPSDHQCWISTTRHTVLEGSCPDDIMQKQSYLSIIEQLRYFNGELISLSEQEEPFYWLTPENLQFFKNNIMQYRSTTQQELTYLQEELVNTRMPSHNSFFGVVEQRGSETYQESKYDFGTGLN